jgi:hypothetical protein
MKHFSRGRKTLAFAFLVFIMSILAFPVWRGTRAAVDSPSRRSSQSEPTQLITPGPSPEPVLVDAVFDPVPGSGRLPERVQSSTNVFTPQQAACGSRMPHDLGMTPHVDLDTLVLVYTNTAMGTLAQADLTRLQQYVSKTAVFMWRQSHLKLRLNVTYLVIDDYKDVTEFTQSETDVYWLYPDDGDGDGISVESDLIAHGVLRDQYDSINYLWPHINHGLPYGGLGGLISWSLGLTGITENPIAWWFSGPDGSVAFDHEIQHTIDFMFEYSGYPAYYHADQPWNLSGAFGEGWDFPRSAMTRWPMEDWFVLCEPWGTVASSPDQDNDDLPDSAIGEFPGEDSLSGSVLMRDTDGDNLDDLAETMAGMFRNSMLSGVDSDADGRMDGNDLYPLNATDTQILKQTPLLNGDPASWNTLASQLTEQNAPLSVSVSTAWDNNYFYIMVIEDRYAGIYMQIDAQNDGWFHGRDNYEIYGIDPSYSDPSDPYIIANAHIWDCSSEMIALKGVPMWDDDANYPFTRLVTRDHILRYARPYGTGFLVQLAIPRNTATGLVPAAGNRIGLLMTFDYLDRQGDTYARLWERWAWVRPLLGNVRDTLPPVSQMDQLPASTAGTSIALHWNGSDAGSGIMYYDVQYRDGASGQWVDWLPKTTATSAAFTGQIGHTYYFRVRLWDQAGNVENYPAGGDTWTELKPHQTTTVITNSAALGTDTVMGQSYPVTFSVTSSTGGTPAGDVTVSDGTDTCVGTVAAGTCNLTSTTPGLKALTATFAGQGNYAGSTSVAVPHTVIYASWTYLPVILNNHHPVTTVNIFDQADDGEVLNINCSSWSSCRNASSGNAMWQGLSMGTVGASHNSGGYTIQRIFYYFDTSQIPAQAQIMSAALHVYAGQWLNGRLKIHVVPSTAGLPLTAADFGKIQFASAGSVTAGPPNTWMEIPISTASLGWIVKGGSTRLALIHDLDLTNSIPAETNDLLLGLAESAYPPYLTVVYYQP